MTIPKQLQTTNPDARSGPQLERRGYKLPTSGAGFTLIEALFSLLIFSIALTAIFYLLVTNLKDASLVKDNFIASGLVQEGMEVVRNLRDEDWFAGRAFGSFGSVVVLADGDYRVQWNSQVLFPFADLFLKKDSGNGLVSYDPSADTIMIFKRTVTISTVSSVEKSVRVAVTWDERGVPKSISAEDHLFDWK